MAKNKKLEHEYLAIGRERARLRRIERNKRHRKNVLDRGMECPTCGGYMRWCSTCMMWTKSCCETYGSCQCS